MRYTEQEALAEILRRTKRIQAERDRRTTTCLQTAASVLSCALILAIVLLPDRSAITPGESFFGSLLLSQEAGGYVLTAVIAFSLGVAVTLACLRYRQANESLDKAQEPRRRSGVGRVRLDDSLLGSVAGGIDEKADGSKKDKQFAQDLKKNEVHQ